jgi:hypothetical protein
VQNLNENRDIDCLADFKDNPGDERQIEAGMVSNHTEKKQRHTLSGLALVTDTQTGKRG